MAKQLDQAQRDLLKFIRNGEFSKFPLSEIQDRLSLPYPQAVFNKLRQLENRGMIRRDANGYVALDNPLEEMDSFPVIGSAQCGNLGQNLCIDEEVAERMHFPTKLLPIAGGKENYVFVRAKGKSMEPLIREGDLMFVRLQQAFSDGDTVLVVHNGKAKVKQPYRGFGGLSLRSKNPTFDDLSVNEDDEFRVIGVVKKIIASV